MLIKLLNGSNLLLPYDVNVWSRKHKRNLFCVRYGAFDDKDSVSPCIMYEASSTKYSSHHFRWKTEEKKRFYFMGVPCSLHPISCLLTLLSVKSVIWTGVWGEEAWDFYNGGPRDCHPIFASAQANKYYSTTMDVILRRMASICFLLSTRTR